MHTLRRFLTWTVTTVVFAASTMQAVEVGDAVAPPEAQLLDSTCVPGDAWRGHPVIITTRASWCPLCAPQNPRLQKLYDVTRDTGLRILTISIDANPQLAKDYVTKCGFTLPVMMGTDALCAATGPRKGLPELLVLDAEGHMTRKEVSEMLENDAADPARYTHSPEQ